MAISAIFALVALTQMAVVVGKSTFTYDQDEQDVDNQIAQAQTELQNFQNDYDRILKENADFSVEVQQRMNENLEKILQLQSNLKIIKENAVVRYRSIQLAGILFIVIISMLFILKGFGFLTDIEQAIVGLFKGKKKS
jgi:ElaB/YqjD/DUF883 family membrane-anchored ribosome-binding protein